MNDNENNLNVDSEKLIVPFSDEIELNNSFIYDVLENSSVDGIIPEYVLEKLFW